MNVCKEVKDALRHVCPGDKGSRVIAPDRGADRADQDEKSAYLMPGKGCPVSEKLSIVFRRMLRLNHAILSLGILGVKLSFSTNSGRERIETKNTEQANTQTSLMDQK